MSRLGRGWKWGAGLTAAALTTIAAAGFGHRAHAEAAARELSQPEAERVLLAAAREGETDLVVGLVRAGARVEARDGRGFTALILAAYHGQTATVRGLLAEGADACATDGRGNTALMGAAFKGHTAVVSALLGTRCGVDQANGVGQTALMFARLFGRGEVAALLEQAGASKAARDRGGRTADDWAATQAPTSPVASEEARR